ncbi:MAG: RsmB/NOP family class I SAM-dependent RNA methyltransferase [Alphaproteobacteria bacterium]|nr:RsmB/NOP family class I SAM-dependent RNA methyltransferase [Alphaproteobacteria bacterium]
MQLEARVKTIIDLFDIFFETSSPFDIIMARYFKNHKWIGSADRRAIAEISYSMFRHFEKLKLINQNITEKFGRFFVLSFLKHEKKYSNKQIDEIFSGRKYAPGKLTDFEIKFINRSLPSSYPLHVSLNYPQWLEPYLMKSFSSPDFENEMKALNETASVDIRVNTLKTTSDEVVNNLKEFNVEPMRYASNGVRLRNGRISRSHEMVINGLIEIQDEGSQLIAEMCQAQPGDIVVDYCAGAGGKTLALACAMQNKGRIFALDKYPERLENAKKRLRRAGVDNVYCQEITGKWMKRHEQFADIVLVDAPCSGTGTWRRNPDMRAKFTQKDLNELLAVQADILRSAQKLVKPGGRLVYSTCSVLFDEDEDQVFRFLKEFPNFSLEDVHLSKYHGKFLKLSPYGNDTDGFFAASFINNKFVAKN